MKSSRRAYALALALLSMLPAAVSAAGLPVVSPIKVKRCDARHDSGSPGGYSYGNYAVGYYPTTSREYHWTDPYAHRYYQPGMSPTGMLYIDFVNVTSSEIKTVEFALVAQGHTVAEVRDVGKFSHGAEIRHEYGVSPDVFPLGTPTPTCVATYVEYADGATWKNPNLPPAGKKLYDGHPK